MRCDAGKGSTGTRYTENEAITIHESRQCKRRATRWINGPNIGFQKLCGYCARSRTDYFRWEYGWFDYSIGTTGALCPEYEAESVFKEYRTRSEVETNAGNHMVVVAKITKEERREYEQK